ncbi:MAG: endolytic transglycosylase MltG [Undibacterium sp.]
MTLFLRIIKFLSVTLLLFAVAAGLSLWYLLSRVESARGSKVENQRFTVGSGEGLVSVAERLEASNIIDSQLTFIVYAVKTGLYKRFQVGEYILSGDLAIPDIVNRIVDGKVVPAGVKVTFPEGWTAKEMADRLNESGLAGDEFLSIASKPFPKWKERFNFLKDLPDGASLEGYLFPDTYIFPPKATGELIVNELLKNFERRASGMILRDMAARGLTFHEVLTLASIVEEEGRTESDRKNISDVFRKRLAIGQPLQSDATINYIHGTAKDQPTFDDLKSTSPYNTYVRAGLPPGPIGNPSLMSIAATLHPTSNPYYYFLINLETRTTYFAEDFEGHQRNRAAHGL